MYSFTCKADRRANLAANSQFVITVAQEAYARSNLFGEDNEEDSDSFHEASSRIKTQQIQGIMKLFAVCSGSFCLKSTNDFSAPFELSVEKWV